MSREGLCPYRIFLYASSGTSYCSAPEQSHQESLWATGQAPTYAFWSVPSKTDLKLGFHNKRKMRSWQHTHKLSAAALLCTLATTHLLSTGKHKQYAQANLYVFTSITGPSARFGAGGVGDSPATGIWWHSVSPWRYLPLSAVTEVTITMACCVLLQNSLH